MTSYDFKKSVLPQLIKFGIGFGVAAVVLLTTQEWLFEISFLKNVDLLTIDYRFQQRYNSEDSTARERLQKLGDVVVLGISDEDLKALPKPFPFPRDYYAHVVENLNRAGAKAIIFDITFEVERDSGDVEMREALKKYNNVVLAAKLQTGSFNENAEVRSLEMNYHNIFFDVDKNIGVVNIIKDRDDICRTYLPMVTVENRLTPTLAFAGLNRWFNLPPLARPKIESDYFVIKDRLIPKYDPTTFMLNYYGPRRTFRFEQFSQVINDASFKTKDELDADVDLDTFDDELMRHFKNKVVIIGSLMAEERDYHNVPIYLEEAGGKKINSMDGVEIHATAIQNVIDNNFVTRLDPALEIVLILGLSVLGFLGMLALKQIKLKSVWALEVGAFVLMLLLVGGIFELGVLLFSSSAVMMNVVNPSLAIILAYLSTAVYQYLTERQQKALIKNVFGHYLSPVVVNMLANDPEMAKLGGDRRELSILFSDIVNFTTVSESFKTPEGLVELLNEYLSEMTSIVLKSEGTLDKYVGDAIIAFWNAPLPQKDHAMRACVAAVEMQRKLELLRLKWKKVGMPEISARIGVNSGNVIVGNIGGKDRFDYTAIGDPVNLASRLEGANKQYHSDIMISDMTYAQVKSKVVVRELDLIQVKGKTEPVKVYELLGMSAELTLSDEEKQSLELYHEGIKFYRQRKWEEAIAYMQQSSKLDPKCFAAQIYTERASLYQLTPPPPDWNGVFVMSSK
jgi:adenylate cyclase